MLSTYLPPLLLALPLASAGILARDFTGTGHIRVLKSDNWKTASPSQTVGCIDDKGKFVVDNDKECGLFKLDTNFPYTLSSRVGNCTFEDQRQERNTDSQFGWMDYAYSCDADHEASVYDQLYSMDGFPEILLCFGEFACYFDAKRAPKKNDELPLWQFRWGYGQEGITPGHVQLQLMWDRVSDEKREVSEEPSHRINLDNAQIPLKGRRKKY